MARQAGGGVACIAEPLEHPWKFSQAELERFAALVAAKAASRATEVCAVLALDKAGTTDYDYSTCINIADAIRARGTKEGV
jgi:hypothetical protein